MRLPWVRYPDGFCFARTMRFGHFPLSYAAGRSHLRAAARRISTDQGAGWTRRGLLAGLVGFATGAGAVSVWRGGSARAEPLAQPRSGDVVRGTVEWALWMLTQPPEDMLSAAGDLERVSMRWRSDGRLVPCFQRLLDLALGYDVPYVDQAGACAVRSLGRLGRADLVNAAAPRVEARADRPDMSAALVETLAKLGVRRR